MQTSMTLSIMLAVALVALGAGSAQAALLTATSTAVPNTEHPELGAWKYCIDLMWDTGTSRSASHFDVLLGLESCAAAYDGFSFASEENAGASSSSSLYQTPSTVYYSAIFNADGDPAVEINGPLVKFEPLAGEPGNTGVAFSTRF